MSNRIIVYQEIKQTRILSGRKINSSCWSQQEISKPRKPMKGLIWNASRTNKHILWAYLPQICPKKGAETIFSTMGAFFRKDLIASKIKQLRYKYRKALDLGK